MTVTLTALADGEVEALCVLAADIWRRHYPALIGSAQTEYMLGQRYAPSVIRAELARGDVWWDVLHESDRMIAYASSFPTHTPAEMKLDKLYVDPARQRRGYGGMLVAHTCERARRLGYRHVILAVNRHNGNAIAAYRKHGFEVLDAIVTDIGGGFVMDDYIMKKPLLASDVTAGKPNASALGRSAGRGRGSAA